MSVIIDYEAEIKLDLPYEQIIGAVVEAALEVETCPYEADVNVLLTDNASIRELNRDFRDTDSATDVLSFPAVDFETPCGYDFLEKEEGDVYFDPDTGDLVLGDIAVSVEKVISQAAEYGHSEKRELAFLTAHSMLHLLGYDHMDDEEREIMEAEQRNIMDAVGIPR